jgi:hypothetical protein
MLIGFRPDAIHLLTPAFSHELVEKLPEKHEKGVFVHADPEKSLLTPLEITIGELFHPSDDSLKLARSVDAKIVECSAGQEGAADGEKHPNACNRIQLSRASVLIFEHFDIPPELFQLSGLIHFLNHALETLYDFFHDALLLKLQKL